MDEVDFHACTMNRHGTCMTRILKRAWCGNLVKLWKIHIFLLMPALSKQKSSRKLVDNLGLCKYEQIAHQV